MGQIVAAMVSCHAPALFLRQPGEDPAQLDATIAAMRRLGRVGCLRGRRRRLGLQHHEEQAVFPARRGNKRPFNYFAINRLMDMTACRLNERL